eukprot:g243.t1
MTSRKQWVCVADTRPLGAPRAVQPRGDEVRRQSGAPRVKILRLLHPRTNKLMPFMMVADHICELQFLEPPTDDELTDGLSSWFVNDSVISDGRLVMASYVDPLFLALPHLMRNATRYSPLSQVLAHPSAVHTRMLMQVNGITDQLRHVCDVNDKHGPDMIFFRWNETKAMTWLRRKVEVAQRLFVSDPSLTNGSSSSGSHAKGLQFCKNPNSRSTSVKRDPTTASCAAWESGLSIISEYLEQSLSEKLRASLVKSGKIMSKQKRSPKKRSMPSGLASVGSSSIIDGGANSHRSVASGGLSAKEQLLAIMNQRPEIKNPVGSMHGPPKKKAKIASKPPPKGQRSVFSFFKKK